MFDLKKHKHDEKCSMCGWIGKALQGVVYDYCPICGGRMMRIDYEVTNDGKG